jgi:anhydro-N-acetylmuramic acid kinase
MQRVIGLMSGTSVDGIDAALVDISGTERDLQVELVATQTYPYPPALREEILAVCGGKAISMEAFAALDDAIANAFAAAALAIQRGHGRTATLIGSHGQTVFHQAPQGNELGYSLQLGRGAVIAQKTGIATCSNFRAADIAVGGHGAPMVPKIDVCLLSHPTQWRCVQNIGGIGNVAVLPPLNAEYVLGSGVRAWDTGPGNVLIDLAVTDFTQGQQTYDQDGQWAAQGRPCQHLVDRWLQHPFFRLEPPKSTGRELFGPVFFQKCLADMQAEALNKADMLATLTEFTAASIVSSYRQFLAQLPNQVLLGGGGSYNPYLKSRIQALLGNTIPVLTTADVGLNASAKEAIAFAVLAYWNRRGIPGNLPSATGAKQAVLLGEVAIPAPPPAQPIPAMLVSGQNGAN